MTPIPRSPNWLAATRRYLAAAAIANLLWESAQVRLYTLWRTGTPGEIAFAVLHCTAGDVLIAAMSLVLALMVVASPGWPESRFGPVMVTAIAFGTAYTVYSEHVNTAIRKSWAYSELMPIVPVVRTGLAPLAQWLVVPALSLAWACRRAIVYGEWLQQNVRGR